MSVTMSGKSQSSCYFFCDYTLHRLAANCSDVVAVNVCYSSTKDALVLLFKEKAIIGQGLDPMAPGNIFLFDFKKQRHGAHALDIVGNLDRDTFSPHGLSIWEDTRHSKTFFST